MTNAALVWLRNDLRIADNPALATAAARRGKVTAIYVHETNPEIRRPGAAARWWLGRSLAALARDLADLGIPLEVREAGAEAAIADAVRRHAADAVYWNRRYEPAARRLDAAIKAQLRDHGLVVESFNAALLVEPLAIETRQGRPYSVFTPF